MKRLAAVCVLLVLLFLPGLAHAGDSPGAGFTSAAPALSGDLVYDLRASSLGYGTSYTIGTFGPDQVFAIKGSYVIFPDSGTDNKLGAGVSVSIAKALAAAGVQNIPAWFTLDVGALLLLDVQKGLELSPAVYCTVIDVPL
jgi:hypothetical protein